MGRVELGFRGPPSAKKRRRDGDPEIAVGVDRG